MMEVINVILLEAVGWGIGLPAGLWLWFNKMLPPEPPMLFPISWGAETASKAAGCPATTPATQNWEEEALVTPFLAIVDTTFVDQSLLLPFPQ